MEPGDDAVFGGLCAEQSSRGEGLGVVAVTVIVITMCMYGLDVCMSVCVYE